jgi:hypothetical protein
LINRTEKIGMVDASVSAHLKNPDVWINLLLKKLLFAYCMAKK